MTRLLSNVHTGPLGFKELGIGKQVIRQTTLAGTRDLMAESLFRFGKYFGWVPAGGHGTKESAEQDDELAVKCIDEMLEGVPGERYADHNSKVSQTSWEGEERGAVGAKFATSATFVGALRPGLTVRYLSCQEWAVFYKANKMDCQLYEIARSTWRAQIQTIIPLTLQKIRANEGDEQDEEER